MASLIRESDMLNIQQSVSEQTAIFNVSQVVAALAETADNVVWVYVGVVNVPSPVGVTPYVASTTPFVPFTAICNQRRSNANTVVLHPELANANVSGAMTSALTLLAPTQAAAPVYQDAVPGNGQPSTPDLASM